MLQFIWDDYESQPTGWAEVTVVYAIEVRIAGTRHYVPTIIEPGVFTFWRRPFFVLVLGAKDASRETCVGIACIGVGVSRSTGSYQVRAANDVLSSFGASSFGVSPKKRHCYCGRCKGAEHRGAVSTQRHSLTAHVSKLPLANS